MRFWEAASGRNSKRTSPPLPFPLKLHLNGNEISQFGLKHRVRGGSDGWHRSMHSNVDFKGEGCSRARRRLQRRREERKFRRGGQICKALELRGRASHLIRRRFYSPCCPNPDKLSAVREAAPPSPPPPSLPSLCVGISPPRWRCMQRVRRCEDIELINDDDSADRGTKEDTM